MSYIGKTPTIGNFQVCDAISVVNNQAAYTMQVGSVNVSPESANHMIVSLNGVIQKPTDAFTVSGSTITFASNLVTGDVINFIQILGNVLDLGVPSDSTVSLAKLTATGTKDSTTFLRGDNTFNAPPLGGITVADQWRLTTSFTGAANPIASNLERVDTSGQGTIGSAMTESSGIFTFPFTGIYFVRYDWDGYINGDSRYIITYIQGTINNSAYNNYSQKATFIQQTQSDNTSASISLCTLVDVTNTTNCKIRFKVLPNNTSVTTNGTSVENRTCMTFIRLGDT